MSTQQHVMISYTWANKDKVWEIEAALKNRGINTWIDKRDMESKLYDSMAKAVENARVVIICMSEIYAKRENCEREAKYAAVKKKELLHIKVDQVNPAGWLGLLLGDKIYVDFTKGEFQDNINELISLLPNAGNPGTEADGHSGAESATVGDDRVAEENLDIVVEYIALDWRELGRKLGINDNNLDAINYDNQGLKLKEVTRQMLREWKQNKGDGATKARLREALVSIKRKDIADKIV